jgi:hypothetical protein
MDRAKIDWWKTLFDEWYLKTDGDMVENEELTAKEVSTRRREIAQVCDVVTCRLHCFRPLVRCKPTGRYSIYAAAKEDIVCISLGWTSTRAADC